MPRFLGLVVGALAVMLFALQGGQAFAAHVACGDVITQDTTLDSDLEDCLGHGIVIGADNVTLDLNGHTIDGVGAGLPGESCRVGVSSGPRPSCPELGRAGRVGVTIRNGTIREFNVGVWLGASEQSEVSRISSSASQVGIQVGDDSPYTLIRNSSVVGNFQGIEIGGPNNRIAGNVVSGNRATGIESEHVTATVIERNLLTGNRDGLHMHAADDNVVSRNRVVGNSGVGVEISDGVRDNLIEGNRVSGNGRGISVGEGARGNRVVRNIVSESGPGDAWVAGAGIVVEGPNQVEANTVSRNFRGILVLGGNEGAAVMRNRILGNAEGIVIRSGSNRIEENRLAGNTAGGIVVRPDDWASGGNRIDRNHVARNGGDGILIGLHPDPAAAGSILSRNVTSENEDDGIQVDDPDTVLSRNRADRNGDLGIEAVPGTFDGGGNMASRNTNPLQCVNVFCK